MWIEGETWNNKKISIEKNVQLLWLYPNICLSKIVLIWIILIKKEKRVKIKVSSSLDSSWLIDWFFKVISVFQLNSYHFITHFVRQCCVLPQNNGVTRFSWLRLVNHLNYKEKSAGYWSPFITALGKLLCLLKQAQNLLFESAAIVCLERLKLADLGGSTQLTCAWQNSWKFSLNTSPQRPGYPWQNAWELGWELHWETVVVVEIVQSVFVQKN